MLINIPIGENITTDHGWLNFETNSTTILFSDFVPTANKRGPDLETDNIINDTENWTMLFSSHLGRHAAGTVNKDLDIKSAIINAVANEVNVPKGQKTGNRQLRKRANLFDVDWYLWNFDNVNYDLAARWDQDTEGVTLTTYGADLLSDFTRQNGDWKYCVAADTTKRGEEYSYDNIPLDGSGTGNAVHGELYFNTYGGVDEYCNDNHDGAQNSGDGRG